MSWADDYYAGTYETTYTSTGVSWTYYVKKFLSGVKEAVRMVPLGKPVPLPAGKGKTVSWDRYVALSRSVSSATLTEGVLPNATQNIMQQLSKNVAEYGAFVQTTSLLSRTNPDTSGKGLIEVVSNHAAEIIDIVTSQEVAANGGYPLRADYAVDTGATFNGIVDSATSTTIVDATLITNTDYGDANDDLNQSVVIITSGSGYGQARAVTDYTQASGTITTAAWDKTPAANDTFTVTSFDAIASGDKLTYANVVHAVAKLRDNKAPAENGYYVAVADNYQLELLQGDALWKSVNTYQGGGTAIFKGEVGKLGGTRFIDTTLPFKFPITTRGTAGTSYGPGSNGANFTESGTGLVSLVPFIGKGAFGVTSLAKKNAESPPVYVKGPDELGQPIPRFSTVGWMIEYMCKALNPMWVVNMGLYDAK